MRKFIADHPFWSVIIVFLITLVLPLPLVLAFKKLGWEMENLRLIIPILESIFIIWFLYYLGWLKKAGFGTKIQDIHVLWLPAIKVLVPISLFGTVKIGASPLLFYVLAIFFTGVSEEGFARGFGLNALLSKGKWKAVFFLAFLFGVGHVTNLFFADFTPTEMIVRLFALMSFAVFYGAAYLRTLNIWPLIFLHTLWDLSLVISGTAGPFMVNPLPASFEIIVGVISVLYAVYILKGKTIKQE